LTQVQPGTGYDAFIPGGAHSNTRLRGGRPVIAVSASGSHVVDQTGREFLDFIMGNGAVFLGHGAPDVVAAVSQCVSLGLTTGVESLFAMQAAEALRDLIPEPGMVRFASTGTEAVLHCLDIARAATGRDHFAKAEGAYHGWAAPLNVSTWPGMADWGPYDHPHVVPASAGLDPSSRSTAIFPFNDLPAAERVLLERRGDIAGVLIEPVLIDIGYVPAERDFLLGLRRLTHEIGALLIFDETLTGFRVARGGAREYYGVYPDLTIYGKAIANGYPLAAVEGRPELMELTNPLKGGKVGFVGTHNGHAVSVAAATAALQSLGDASTLGRLEALTHELEEGVKEVASTSDVPMVFAGGGGHFQIYFTEQPVTDYRSAATSNGDVYRSFVAACDRAGILYPDTPLSHASLSTSHSSGDLHRLIAALDEATRDRETPTAGKRAPEGAAGNGKEAVDWPASDRRPARP
jgi:glutamate-1-semialdehyde 2,1-aminomutase